MTNKYKEALRNLVEAVDNHTKSYGDREWRNQACAQLEVAERKAMEALNLDYYADEFAAINTRENKVSH